ncbi:MAG: R3H domain-containing nucleic acid-binding protein [Candidatus Moranbacteria bacterium]|nr:R3H domain-containing nucleic acid-binding protein [Candidatus Moranbacteria bacterium]
MGFEERKKIMEGVTREILDKMEVQANIYIANDAMPEDDSVHVQIHTRDSRNLIGRSGNNLFALQHIIRAIVAKKLGERVNFTVDVNSYIENQKEAIIEKALEAIDKAQKTGKEQELPPMNAYERRLVHMQAANRNGIESESAGEGEERRVVIKSK